MWGRLNPCGCLCPPPSSGSLLGGSWCQIGRCRCWVGRFGLVCGPSLLVWRSVGYSVQVCCIFHLFLLYSGYGCLQSKNHKNLWKWLVLSPITTFGAWKLWKDAGVDGFISVLRTVNNTPTLSLCSSSSKEAETKVDPTPLKKPAYKLFQVFSQTCELFECLPCLPW
jgi:hypothetical protein